MDTHITFHTNKLLNWTTVKVNGMIVGEYQKTEWFWKFERYGRPNLIIDKNLGESAVREAIVQELSK